MWRADSFEKTLMLGKIEGRRRRGWQRMRWLDGITDSVDMSWVNSGSWWWTGRPGMLRFMGLQRVRHDLATELNWSNRYFSSGFYELNTSEVGDTNRCTCTWEFIGTQTGVPLPVVPAPGSLLLDVRVLVGLPLVAQLVKNWPATQETPIQFLGWEDLLEKG